MVFWNACGGRSNAFAWACLIFGFTLALRAQLDTTFVALVTALYAFVVGRAVGADLTGKKA